MILAKHPVLSRAQARACEKSFFDSGKVSEEVVMRQAGHALAQAIIGDMAAIGGMPKNAPVLVLAGKGHNAGDALFCASFLKEQFADAKFIVWMCFPVEEMRPLSRLALQEMPAETEYLNGFDSFEKASQQLSKMVHESGVALCLDGVFGLNERPELPLPVGALITMVNQLPNVRMRVAVDVPSGLSGEVAGQGFRADFTYATGIVKEPVTRHEAIPVVGRLRYLDLGFFATDQNKSPFCVLTEKKSCSTRQWLPADSHKRKRGHLLLVAGSRYMPGACLMAAEAALRGGVGLLTVAAPDSVKSVAAARIPEAMWVPMSADGDGQVGADPFNCLKDRIGDFDAIVFGPGIGRGKAAQGLRDALLDIFSGPIVLDADGLQPGLLEKIDQRDADFAEVIITPHEGEYIRLGGTPVRDNGVSSLQALQGERKMITVLKGPRTKIAGNGQVWLCPAAGPVLSRGGTGDILAGLIGAGLANADQPTMEAVAGAVWLHACLGDRVAALRGEQYVRATDLLL